MPNDGSLFLLLDVQQILELGHEFANVAEVTIDRGEPDVGDLVQHPELVHHERANLLGAHLALGFLLQRRLDPVSDRLERSDADGPLLTRFEQPGQQLLPLEPFAAAVLLDHHVGDLVDPLVTGEPAPAAEALAAPADDLPLLALAGIHHFVAEVRAVWTLHEASELASFWALSNVRPSRAIRTAPRRVTGMNDMACSTMAAPMARSSGAAKKVCTAT